MKRALLLLLALVTIDLHAETPPRRVALVYGNSDYGSEALPAAASDASAIRDKLVELEFDEVIFSPNADKEEMEAALNRFKTELRTADQAFVYYSGHGAQINGDNYLLPARSPKLTRTNIFDVAFPVAAIYNALRDGRSQFNLVVLDACRTNPLLEAGNTDGECNGWQCGLARPTGAPSGTIVAFATAPDKLADDLGPDDTHSPYSAALLSFMGEPGLPIHDFFLRVREQLAKAGQVSWESTSQKLPFMFRDPAYVEVTIRKADDEATVLLNGQTVNSSIDGGSPRRLRLSPGRNVLTLTLFNQRSRRGLVSLQEGWEYDVAVKPVEPKRRPAPSETPADARLESREVCRQPTFEEVRRALPDLKLDPRGNLPLPWDCLPRTRFGSSFRSARMGIDLDQDTGKISFAVIDDEMWRDGFSLADNKVRDEIDQSVAWAIVRQNVPLYDGQFPGAMRPLGELRNQMSSAHRAFVGAKGTSHGRAVEVLRVVDDEALDGAIRSARHWELGARGDLTESIRWAIGNSPEFAALRGQSPRNYGELRKAYERAQAHNPEEMFALALISNGELEALLNTSN